MSNNSIYHLPQAGEFKIVRVIGLINQPVTQYTSNINQCNHVPVDIPSKKCTKCHTVKPLSEFYIDTKRSTHSSACKVCKSTLGASVILSPDATLRCNKCNIDKPVDEFAKRQSSSTGRAYTCKACKKSTRESKIVTVDGYKKCNKCNTSKHVTEFRIDRATPDGRRYICADCQSGNKPQLEGIITCACCNETLPVTNFHINKRAKTGRVNWCKNCTQKRDETRKHQTIVIDSKICNMCNEELPLSAFNKWQYSKDGAMTTCRECNSQREKEKRANCVVATDGEKCCTNCHQVQPINNFAVCRLSPDGRSTKCKECRSVRNHKNHRRMKKRRNTINDRIKTDPLYALTTRVRASIHGGIKRYINGNTTKSSTTCMRLLGCTMEEFMDHFVSTFYGDITLDDFSTFHIDHIVPISFAQTEEELYMLNHYTNLRALTRHDNITKGDKLTDDPINHPIYHQIMALRNQTGN